MNKKIGINIGLYAAPTLIIALVMLLTSCAAEIILPGLCYTDKEGTFLCPEIEKIKPEPIMPDHERIWKDCEPFLYMDAEAWTNCILIADINTIYGTMALQRT